MGAAPNDRHIPCRNPPHRQGGRAFLSCRTAEKPGAASYASISGAFAARLPTEAPGFVPPPASLPLPLPEDRVAPSED